MRKRKILYKKDYAEQHKKEYQELVKSQKTIQKFKETHPEWKRQMDRLDQEMAAQTPRRWSVDPSKKMIFDLLLAKCEFYAEMLGGSISAEEGPFQNEASIILILPHWVVPNDEQEDLLRYIGTYAHCFSIHPHGSGLRVELNLPYFSPAPEENPNGEV